MNKHAFKKPTETTVLVSEQGKFDYKALVAEAKALGLDTKGKAFELDARINEYHLANTPAVVEEEVKTERRGRPIDPNSPRQIRLSQKGMAGRGRPADPTSAWNIKQAALAAKRAEGTLKLGRAINPESERQKRLALVGKVKRGRPAFKNIEPVVSEVEAIVDAEAENVLENMLSGGTEV